MADLPPRKDIWDRITALATILIPAAIALAGHFISQGLKQAEIQSEERRAAQASALADANTKIAQAGLINTMMKSLTSGNAQERRLAVQAVLIALPEQGPALVRTVAQTDEDKAVQAYARTSIEQRVEGLVRGIFASDPSTRQSAAQDFVQGWRNEPPAVALLVNYALQHADNANGIYNTVVVLGDFSPRALAPNRALLTEFAAVARQTGPKTEARVIALQKKLDGG